MAKKRKRVTMDRKRKRVSTASSERRASASTAPVSADARGEASESEANEIIADEATSIIESEHAPSPGSKGIVEDDPNQDTPDPRRESNDPSPTLVAETVHIRKDTINKKWDRLAPKEQTAIKKIFADVAQPVIAAQLGERAGHDARDAEGKPAEVQRAIQKVVAALNKRLPQMPIPPKTPADTFDYEKLVRETGNNEARLADYASGIALLKTEIKNAERTKSAEKEEIAELRDRVEEYEAQLSKRHNGKYGSLLRMPDEEPEDSARRIRLAPSKLQGISLKSESEIAVESKKIIDELSEHIRSLQSLASKEAANLDVGLRQTVTAAYQILLSMPIDEQLEAG